jgi:Fe-S cluster biogenesis protein NfuA
VHDARWTAALLDAALDEARALVRSDGADLTLVEADPATARVVLRLEVGDETCATGSCVMPGDALRPLIADVLARRLRGALDLQLIDPRSH